MRLIDDWKQSWRLFSMQAFGAIAGVAAFWDAIPPEVKLLIPAEHLRWIVAIVAISGGVGRLIKQGPKE